MSFVALQNFRTMLSTSARFQTMVGAGNAAAALAKIFYFGATGDPITAAAYIRSESGTEDYVGFDTWVPSGTLTMELEIPRRSAATLSAEYAAIAADWDVLIDQLKAASVVTGVLSFRTVTRQPILLAENRHEDSFWVLSASFDWPNSV